VKITFLLTQSLESPSGLGRYGPLARALADMGHQVEVFALHPNFGSLEKTTFEDRGVWVHYAAPMHVRKQGSQKSYYPAWKLLGLSANAALKLSLAAIKSDADVIHVGKPHPMNSLAGLAARLLRGKRLLLDCDDYETASSRFSGNWQRRGVAFFEKRMPQRAEMVTTNTHFMKNLLVDWGVPPEKIIYLPNGVERSRFRPPDASDLAQLRQKHGLAGKQVISFIGSLSLPSHPVDLLVDAFALLAVRLPQAVLLLVGGGEDYEALQRMVRQKGLEERTVFTGRAAPDQVGAYYAVSTVTVDPVHDNEAARGRSPLKLFESWLCGTPFVTADVGDRRSLLGEPAAGVLAEGHDAAAYARAIEQVLTSPGMAESLRQRGLERVEAYTWDQLTRQVESVYLGKPASRLRTGERQGYEP
jgi:glycosyltransferase involved in cell wall biosynthesis